MCNHLVKDTKESTGKSMKNASAYCSMQKGTSQAIAMTNSEKIKELCQSEVSYLLSKL